MRTKRQRKTDHALVVNDSPVRCIMLSNSASGFARQHTRNCAASIKIDKGRHRTCEDSGATKHIAYLSGDRGDRVMSCMNVCVSCAERESTDRTDVVVHDAVYRERWEGVAA